MQVATTCFGCRGFFSTSIRLPDAQSGLIMLTYRYRIAGNGKAHGQEGIDRGYKRRMALAIRIIVMGANEAGT